MQTRNLNVIYGGQSYAGFDYENLPLPAALIIAAAQIDQAADSARGLVVGDPLRAQEHDRAAAEARTFAAGGYAGEMPAYVKAWADAASLDPQAAADSILVEADAWQAALLAIRTIRLKGKQDALKAVSHEAAEVVADAAIAAIRESVQGVGNAA
ncbi:hypothetical protein [Pseudomonas serbica]|jgi:hypothetical protein